MRFLLEALQQLDRIGDDLRVGDAVAVLEGVGEGNLREQYDEGSDFISGACLEQVGVDQHC